GLGEDEVEEEATMYYKTARCDTKQRDLIETDVEAVRTVYSAPLPDEADGPAAAGTCSVSQQRQPGSAWPALLALLALMVSTARRGAPAGLASRAPRSAGS